MKITKKIMEDYIKLKGQLDVLTKEEKKLKKQIVSSLDDKKFFDVTDKTSTQKIISGFVCDKTLSVTKPTTDYKKFFEMYYNPTEHTVVPQTEEKIKTTYKFKREEK